MKYPFLIFDVDGTLIDSLPTVTAALNKMLLNYSDISYDVNQVSSWIGHGASDMIEKAFSASNIIYNKASLNEAIKLYLDFYRENPVDNTYIYPNVIEVLNTFKNNNVSMGICSNKPFEMINRVLEALGMAKYFSAVAGGDSYTYCKPDAQHIQVVAQAMQAVPQKCLMIGDSATDIDAANNAKIASVLVSYGYLKNRDIVNKCTYLIDDFSQLVPIVNG